MNTFFLLYLPSSFRIALLFIILLRKISDDDAVRRDPASVSVPAANNSGESKNFSRSRKEAHRTGLCLSPLCGIWEDNPEGESKDNKIAQEVIYLSPQIILQ